MLIESSGLKKNLSLDEHATIDRKRKIEMFTYPCMRSIRVEPFLELVWPSGLDQKKKDGLNAMCQ